MIDDADVGAVAHQLGRADASNGQVPEEEVPIRSVTIASDGSCLVAGNNKVRSSSTARAP